MLVNNLEISDLIMGRGECEGLGSFDEVGSEFVSVFDVLDLLRNICLVLVVGWDIVVLSDG